MKRYCKHIDITDAEFIRPFIADCIFRHYKRHDFRKFLIQHGLTKERYNDIISHKADKSCLNSTINNITDMITDLIRREDLSAMKPVTIRTRHDNTCGKVREIGCECPLQQCLDFIAVGASMELFNKRIVPQQCASIDGRGQLYGVRMIQKWIKKDNGAIRYAARHSRKYSPHCKYFVKLDIKKCYPSMRMEHFMRMFRRDCANKKLIWLWRSLLSSHRIDEQHQGLMIGSLISQWAAQYIISFAYRYVMSLHKYQYKDQTKVSHMCIFMDDMLLIGSNRRELSAAVNLLRRFMLDNFGLRIKEQYNICELCGSVGIDMMGYVVYRSGKVAVRARNFIKLRRQAMRYNRLRRMTYRQAKHFISYKGYFMHSNNYIMKSSYQMSKAFMYAGLKIGNCERQRKAQQR